MKLGRESVTGSVKQKGRSAREIVTSKKENVKQSERRRSAAAGDMLRGRKKTRVQLKDGERPSAALEPEPEATFAT